MAEADATLQPLLWESTRLENGTQFLEMKMLPQCLSSNGDALLQLMVKQMVRINESDRL